MFVSEFNGKDARSNDSDVKLLHLNWQSLIPWYSEFKRYKPLRSDQTAAELIETGDKTLRYVTLRDPQNYLFSFELETLNAFEQTHRLQITYRGNEELLQLFWLKE